MDDNDKNTYNQNFSGVYCTCHRPYPDPDDSTDDEMIQCILCEDWFHSRHLNATVPESNAFDEMICDECTTKNEFLNYYSGYCIETSKDDGNETINSTLADTTAEISLDKSAADINVTDLTDVAASTSSGCGSGSGDGNNDGGSGSGESAKPETEKNDEMLNAEINQCIQDLIEIRNKSNEQSGDEVVAVKRAADNLNENAPAIKRFKDDEQPTTSNTTINECRKPTIALKVFTGASFWPLEWRSKLCKCTKCKEMYQANGVEYLIDDDDTVHAYQERGKAKAADIQTTEHDQTMRALSGMDRVAQIEAIMAYNKLKQKLTEFLGPFVANEQVITANDVETFFQTMSNKKKD